MGENSLWVFGYGSLCWRPGFDHGESVVGHIQGFSRRFWQGNTTHRGTPGKPGRVATLMEDRNSRTHGVALQLLGRAALEYLDQRECTLGGYTTHMTTFYPRREKDDNNKNNNKSSRRKAREPFPVMFYMATPANEQWLGPAPITEVAEQVLASSGDAGHNVEYVLRLADWIRQSLPEVVDDHLFSLETHIRFRIRERKLCLRGLMDKGAKCHLQDVRGQDEEEDEEDVNMRDESVASSAAAFASRVTDSRHGLKCVKF